MKKLFLLCFMFSSVLTMNTLSATNIVASEGAWCWFADSRALHYENAAGTINATYLGYIDVHGNVKATQYDWLKQRKTDVLIRSFFQPDDHNNPTFLVLPDERVMIFYTRHTDEAKIWYRISRKPGDITDLGDEKYLTTANNTTYPSPFILSDDPQHIYLCWRGINWHPTIARLTIPDQNDNCHFDFGPKQIVQSTGARPYAKYQSNGKDKIYVSYTTGHPDNEQPNWLYFNVIDINNGNGPILRDLNGKQLSVISNGVFNVSKTDSYANQHPATIVDKTANVRNWVWQIALDHQEHPVIAYPHIDNDKTTHVYWYARWNGTAWKNTWVQYAGHAFHQNWNQTERCYSGGMTIDPSNINNVYLSIPTKNGQYNKDGVYELWCYTIDDEGKVSGSEQLTEDSPKNNVRPFVIPGTQFSVLRLAWMQGDYYYWMVNKSYPQGFPTSILCNFDWQEPLTPEADENESPRTDCICLETGKTVTMAFELNADTYEGTLFTVDHYAEGDGGLVYSINAADQRPQLSINGTVYKSQNHLLTSDNWALNSTGTNGDNHPTKLKTVIITLTYDGHVLTVYRNGLVDQVVETENLPHGTLDTYGEDNGEGQLVPFHHKCLVLSDYYACASPLTVQALALRAEEELQAQHNQSLPRELQNGDFEGTYAPMPGSGVTNDRAIYVPEGWTVDYISRNENDLTALKSGDLYFDRFFGSRPSPSANSRQTYWVRQNWGTSTIALQQELLLPEGEYTLTAQVWKSGLGGDAYVSATTQGGATVSAPTVGNMEAWQQMTLEFESNGKASTTIALTAMHNNNGTEKIIGFDNVMLTRKEVTGVGSVPTNSERGTMNQVYDLQGRQTSRSSAAPGIYIHQGHKVVLH